MLKDYALNKADNQKWLKGIGLFQIIGGAVGLLLFFVPGIGFTLPVLNIFYLPGILLFGLSIYAGQLAFRLKDNCLKWTIINQSLQLFSVFVGHYGYQYISGVCLNVTVDFSVGFQMGVDFKLSTFSLAFGSSQEKYLMSINLITVYIIYKIENIKTEIKTKLEMQESLKKNISTN